MNRRLKKFVAKDSGCFILAGDRGAGKSTTLALFADVYKKLGYRVFCQYPYKGCYQIPMVEVNIKGVKRLCVSKDWLYSVDLTKSCVLLDEGKNIWPARDWSKWTQSDDDFFDFIRKTQTVIVIATLAYDCLDINIRRAADFTIFMQRWFWHFTKFEVSHTTVAKVADKTKEVLGNAGRQGMIKVNWEVVEVPIGNYNFWRRSYYNNFMTEYVQETKPDPDLNEWDEDLFKF